MRSHFLAAASAVALCACSNHPVIDDTTGYTTFDIVQKVRCEARGELMRYASFYRLGRFASALEDVDAAIASGEDKVRGQAAKVTKTNNDIAQLNLDTERTDQRKRWVKRNLQIIQDETKRVLPQLGELIKPEQLKAEELDGQSLDERTEEITRFTQQVRALADKKRDLEAEQERLNDLAKVLQEEFKTLQAERTRLAKAETNLKGNKKRRSDPKELGRYVDFLTTNIAMQFRFEITETDNASTSGLITWPVHLGSISLGYSAGAEKKRFSERWVAVAISFADLMKLNTCDSDGSELSQRARLYPITGNVGIAELVEQYLTIVDNSGGFKAPTKGVKDGVFSDKLQFTTTLKGGVKPSLSLSPVAHAIKLDADLNAGRTDLHEVIVDIAPSAPSPDKGTAANPLTVSIDRVPEVGVRVQPDPLDDLTTGDGNFRSSSFKGVSFEASR